MHRPMATLHSRSEGRLTAEGWKLFTAYLADAQPHLLQRFAQRVSAELARPAREVYREMVEARGKVGAAKGFCMHAIGQVLTACPCAHVMLSCVNV